MAKKSKVEVKVNRREVTDRRIGDNRRQQETTVGDDRRKDDRRKVQRRRQIDPTTCERDYTDDEIQFMHALDEYKRASGRMFPTCSEILEVLRALGYHKVSDPGEALSSHPTEQDSQQAAEPAWEAAKEATI